MAAPKRLGPLTTTALIGGPLLAAAIAVAGPVHADDVSYLNDLHGIGLHDVGGGDSALLVTGWKICSQLSAGATPQQLADLALQRSDSDLGAKGLSPQQAADLIGYARQDLCPRA
ncbi:hypothetical protein BN971_04811 [Mycobacterium bohemicum DSM 44277]|jgi:hypothetical protein|uniref:DUF732 domain-containing protein n=2 Tax=Mycobacterium bohemicum TaxID=56425 RepID=A0A1X1QXK1_MYCBE|nr:DUF732 domain-containing protein [Mycobacterium bohemicum]MCV6971107.1 DUF732 domain-containing protein [Mycobacterium bohemicum]ORU96122.1 hypothetical protein AWB93_00105 [Mycobacterium bohemicum]CPR13500.1 hypothetical protein BN971_04811 [Mycobacterium bohemicum DSM 44277]